MAITAELFEQLTDAEKPHFVANGDVYELKVEDVTGLKAKRDELLAELKKKNDITKQFEGLNPEEARKALTALSEMENKKLADKGRFDELLAKREQDWKAQLAEKDAFASSVMNGFKQKELALTLLEKGVRKEYLDLAGLKLDGQIEVENKNGTLQLRVKDGIGDAAEFDALVEGLKTKYPALFEPNGASGSGASGSNGNGGNAKTMSKVQWDAMGVKEQAAFIKSGGSIAQ